MLELKNADNFQIGRALVKTYRQWDSLEKRKKTDIKVIDIDVAPYHVKTQPFLDNRRQVEVRLVQIVEALDKTTADGQGLSAKARAALAFLQDLRRGERLPWHEYVEITNGALPIEVPQGTIKRQYDVTRDIFKTLGYNLDPQGWHDFFEKEQLNPLEFEATFNETEQKALPVILEMLKIPVHLKYRTKSEKLDKPWINWITGDRSGFVLKINNHPSHQNSRFRGNPETLAIHEVGGHIVQASALRRGIDRNIVNPGYGIMTVPGPEQWGAEGIAVTLPYLLHPLLDALSDYGRFALEYRLLRYMVEGNALIDLHKNNPPTNLELTQRIQHYVPNRTEEGISKFLKEGKTDPIYRSYYRAYEDGSCYFRRIVDELPDSDRSELVRSFYTQPMTPRQIKEWVWQRKSDLLKPS